MPQLTNDDMRREALAESDPELLGAVDRIRFAEDLIREDHPVLGADALFWGKLADILNRAAGIPGRTANTGGTWAEFTTAGDLATGYIRMARPSAETTARLLARDFAPPFRQVCYAVQASDDGTTWPGALGEVERQLDARDHDHPPRPGDRGDVALVPGPVVDLHLVVHRHRVKAFGTDRTIMRLADYARFVLDTYLADVASDAGAEPGTPGAEPCTALRALVWLGELPGPLAEAATAEHVLPWQVGAGGLSGGA